MSACERCWSDAHGDPYKSVADEYHRLIERRVGPYACTPEQQAGPYAKLCSECGLRPVRHQHTRECMTDPRHQSVPVEPKKEEEEP